AAPPAPLLTPAEASDYRATSGYAQVMAFCRELAKRAPLVRLAELGRSAEGRPLPLLILSDPPVASPEEAARSGKPVLFALGHIQAGEVDGKEALLMLAREVALGSHGKPSPLLKDAVVVLAPILNADGNERIAKTNRPGQNGPEETGIRENAQGLDLNRDFTKLETPEVRALIRFARRWDPAMVVDTHTTDGSYHRYLITYDGPRNPATPPGLVTFARETLLPDAERRFEASSPYQAFFYGNFAADHTQWVPYPPQPRYGVQYLGLRNCLGILSESYTYAPFRDGCVATKAFVRACLEAALANREKLRAARAEARTVSRRQDAPVALAAKIVPLREPATIRGWVEAQRNGRAVARDRPKDY